MTAATNTVGSWSARTPATGIDMDDPTEVEVLGESRSKWPIKPRKSIAAPTVTGLPTPRRIRLTTIEDVGRELRRLYRDARAGAVDTQDASRLSFVLDRLKAVIECTTLERRLAALEMRNGEKP